LRAGISTYLRAHVPATPCGRPPAGRTTILAAGKPGVLAACRTTTCCRLLPWREPRVEDGSALAKGALGAETNVSELLLIHHSMAISARHAVGMVTLVVSVMRVVTIVMGARFRA
jgi:hypothetical protein